MRWSRIIRPAYALMLVWALAAATFVRLNLESLPARIVSGRGPGGLRHAPKEALWLFPGLVLFLFGLGLFTEYLRRVSPNASKQFGRVRPGMDRERNDLQRATVAVLLSWAGLGVASSVYSLWLLNTGRATPDAVFGWGRWFDFGPLALMFAIYLLLDRRYVVPKQERG